jgi:hypothetical protein
MYAGTSAPEELPSTGNLDISIVESNGPALLSPTILFLVLTLIKSLLLFSSGYNPVKVNSIFIQLKLPLNHVRIISRLLAIR